MVGLMRLLSFVPAMALAVGPVGADERVDRTGSRLGAEGSSRVIVQFNEPQEIRRVLELLENGRTDDALALAQDYLEGLANVVHVGEANPALIRYSALNAVCAAFTKAGRLDEAVAACSEAIELVPGRWAALNNRGTAYLLHGRYEDALADYRRALETGPRADGAVATIEHNIRLAVDRRDESN